MQESPSVQKKSYSVPAKRTHNTPLDGEAVKRAKDSVLNHDVELSLDQALQDGDWQTAEKLIDSQNPPNINESDFNEQTRLHRACVTTNTRLVKVLIGLGANVDLLDQNNQSALILASRKGQKDSIKALLRAGANPNLINRTGDSALSLVTKYRSVEMVELLLSNQASPQSYKNNQNAPLYHALYKYGQLDINPTTIKMAIALIKSGATCEVIKESELGDLFIACSKIPQGVELLNAMKDSGVDFKSTHVGGEPLLFGILRRRPKHVPKGSIDIIRHFIKEFGFSAHLKHPKKGDSLLHVANNILDAAALLDAGLDPNAINDERFPVLFRAVQLNHIELVKYLKQRGADTRFVSQHQLNLVHYSKVCRNKQYTKQIKNLTGLSPKVLDEQAQKMNLFLADCKSHAEKQGKSLMILMGEAHGCYPIYQIEKLLMKAAMNEGVKHYFVEMKSDRVYVSQDDQYMPMSFLRKQKDIKIMGVDNGKSKTAKGFNIDSEGMMYRDSVMSTHIDECGKDGLLITGAAHLYGMLKRHNTKLDTKKFFIVPFNLSSLYDIDLNKTEHGRYITNPENVIQINEQGEFNTNAYEVVSHINGCQFQKPENKSKQKGCVIC